MRVRDPVCLVLSEWALSVSILAQERKACLVVREIVF